MVGTPFPRSLSENEHVERIYKMAGHHCVRPPGPYALIRALGGELLVSESPPVFRGDALVEIQTDGWTVEIHEGLPLPFACLALGRALARWYSRVFRVPLANPPDSLAAAIILPHAALALSCAAFGNDVAAIADQFVIPLAIAAERLGDAGPPSQSGEFLRLP